MVATGFCKSTAPPCKPNRAIRRLGGGPQGMANASSNSWDGIRWCTIGKSELYEGMATAVDRVKEGDFA